MMDAPKKKKTENKDLPEGATPEVMSLGEKWYNRLVYQGLNYWANLGISLVITDFFLHGKGKDFFHSGVEKSTAALHSMGMGKKGAKWLSEIALGTFSLNSGGNILLIPTKYLEDNKRPIVHWLNDKLGVDQTAMDGHKMTADEIYIEHEQDKQSWLRMIGRRALGWGATTSVGLTLDRVLAKKLPVKTRVPHEHLDMSIPQLFEGEKIHHVPGQQVFTEAAVKGANSVLSQLPGGSAIVNSPTAQRYMGYAALDWIYTIITSKVLHATNGAHKKEKAEQAAAAVNQQQAVQQESGGVDPDFIIHDEKHEERHVTIDAKDKLHAEAHEHKHEHKHVRAHEHKLTPAEIVRAKDHDKGFAETIAGKETANNYSLGA